MKAAVVGGGYAGMAAALTLAEAGADVTVLEAGAVLGGRARRVEHQGTLLDNGLHILLGAYTETLRLVHRLHGQSAPLLQLPLDLHVKGEFRLRRPNLPAPLHALGALCLARGLSLADKLAAARFMHRMRQARYLLPRDGNVADLLARHGQGERARRLLWDPLCISALNTPPGAASAQVFLNVLRDSLAGAPAASDLVFARTDLSALFPEKAARHIEAQGGRILTGTAVTRIAEATTGLEVHTRDGPATYDRIVCALPPHRTAAVLRAAPALADVASAINALAYEPIYSVFLQFSDGVELPAPMIGLAGRHAQWVFDRGQLCGQHGLLGVVISARGEHQSITQDALATAVETELRERLGPLPLLAWHRVFAEKRATFSCVPGVVRPGNATRVRGLFLAGDYTASDYPATIEAAVRSGLAAARLALS